MMKEQRIKNILFSISCLFSFYVFVIIIYRIIQGIRFNNEIGVSNSTDYYVLVLVSAISLYPLKTAFNYTKGNSTEQKIRSKNNQIVLSIISILILIISIGIANKLSDEDYSIKGVTIFKTVNFFVICYFILFLYIFTRKKNSI